MNDPRDNPFRRRQKARSDAQNDSPERGGNRRDSGGFRGQRGQGGPGRQTERGRGDKRGPRGEKRAQGGPVRKAGPEGVLRQGQQGRGLRQLPEEMAKLADGRVERLRGPRRAPAPLADERVGFVLAGVRNHDARSVYDARVARLREARARGDRAAVAQGLCDARRLTLWRARAVVDFAAFAESVVGISSDEAEALASEGAARAGCKLDALPPHVIALWMRLEAALARACPEGRVEVTGDGDELAFGLRIPGSDVGRVIEGFFDMGGAASGLRKFLPAAQPRGSHERERS